MMVELASARKNKICLSDYNYRRDIENRLLIASFSPLDKALLDEILFSPIKVPIRKLAKNIDTAEESLTASLEKFRTAGLLVIEGDSIVVDKEMRKYFETQGAMFEQDFKPDMDFLQGLLRKVPIHVLPAWYAIPRSSNNIFDSILEKYLLTPQIFQRYLMELNLGDPTLAAIVQDVYRCPDFKFAASEIMDKYALTHEQFEECMLHLEFNFLCCLCYEEQQGAWREIVTPFYEWREYLSFIQRTTPKPFHDLSLLKRFRPHDFSFVLDMAAVLQTISKQPISIGEKGYALLSSKLEDFEGPLSYIEQIIRKLILVKLAQETNGMLEPTENTAEWLEMRLETRALFLFRHFSNKIISSDIPSRLLQEKTVRDAEKTLSRILNSGWVFFDEFANGVTIPLGDCSPVVLKKSGKHWGYSLPEYGDEEKALLKAVVFEWLFEAGITSIGSYDERDCFLVTAFGQSIFG